MASSLCRGHWGRVSSKVVVFARHWSKQWVGFLSRNKSYHNTDEKVITKEIWKKPQCSFRSSPETRGTTVSKEL